MATHATEPLDSRFPQLAKRTTAGSLPDLIEAWPTRDCYIERGRKAEVLAFCDGAYPGWREHEQAQAKPFLSITREKAAGPRALHQVAALGRAWWATGDPKYGQAFDAIYTRADEGELHNWRQFAGAQAAFELPAHLLLADCEAYTPRGRAAFLHHIFGLNEQAWDRYVSQWSQLMLGPEGHNWYIHGIASLPYVGLLFPQLERASFYVRAGWSVIEEHVRGNYHRDGGSRERTPGYHAGTLTMVWRLYAFVRRNGLTASAAFEPRLLRATHFLIDVMTPIGGVPAFGDSNAGRGHLAGLFAMAAAVAGDPRCKWAAEQARAAGGAAVESRPSTLPYNAFWSLGLDGAQAYEKVEPAPPSQRSICLPDTGLATMRDGWEPEAHCLSINAGARGPIVTSHGHNDIFSFDLYAGGTRLLGQAGIAPYDDHKPGRAYDVSTRGHNCLTIRGEEQVAIANQWRWDNCVIPRIRRWKLGHSLELFHGVHEGFYRLDRQVLHERTFLFIRPPGQPTPYPYWIILDRVEATDVHEFEIWFHGCVPADRSGLDLRLSADNDQTLWLGPPVGDQLKLDQDQSEGFFAYCDEARVQPEHHPAYRYRAQAASHLFVWTLCPLSAGQPAPRVERVPATFNGQPAEGDQLTALRIEHGSVVDELCVSHRPYDGELAHATAGSRWGHTWFRRLLDDQVLHEEHWDVTAGSDAAMP